jgi:membrane protein implicated in regulation of membrane protease activity
MEWWMWVTAGLLLVVLELVTPLGFYLMFFGLGALTVGLLERLHVINAAWLEWLLFTASSLIYVLLFRGRIQQRVETPAHAVDTMIGELATPKERILPGTVGRVEVRGTVWNARNETSGALEPGQRCRVARVDNLMLYVQPE